MEVCRACLGEQGELTPLNESLVTAYNLITNLNVSLMDTMPQFTCANCLQALKFCMDFREKCIETETSLQQVLKQKVKTELKLEIKEETPDDLAFDNGFNDDFSNFDELNILMEKETTEGIKPKNRKYTKKKKKCLKMLEDVISKSCDNDMKPKKRKYTKKAEPEIILHSCGLCKEQFTDKEMWTKHVETHKNERRCSLCPEIFSTWPALVGHRIAHVPKTQKRCHVCYMYMFGVNHCQSHYIKEHTDGEKTKLACSQCSNSFDNIVRLKKHIYYFHSNRKYICDFCGKTTKTRPLLISHMRSHMGIKSFKCDLCNFTAKLLGGLKDHKIRKHSPDKVKCKPCNRWFSSPAHMETHKCTPVTKICPICGIPVYNRLNKHLQTHSNVAPYKCDRCPAMYKSHEALKSHLNRHDNRRTKQCEFCERKFFTTSVLIKHRRVHTGEKPYVCKVCNRGFTGNHNLKVHMKVHGEDLVQKRIKPEMENLAAFYNFM